MRQQYDSFKYWENIISEHKTLRGHMFMHELPTKKTLYIHTLIFSKNAVSNVMSLQDSDGFSVLNNIYSTEVAELSQQTAHE